jgi:membrane protein
MSRSETTSNRSNASDTSGAESGAPDPNHSAKPDSPGEMTKPSWMYVARKTVREFSKDQCTDLAAALTYYSVLALFPAAIALLSLVSVFGQGTKTVDTLLGILSDVGASSAANTIRPTLVQLSQSQGAGLALVAGLLGALWSASGYVGAFGRAMNRMYEVGEGRPFWKLRPTQLLVTAVLLVLVAVGMLGLIVSGPLVDAIGNALGLGSVAKTVWSIAKWPLLVVIAVLAVAILYYGTPNVRQPKFRWLSIGAMVALVVWALLSVAFGFYVSNFSSYDKTYGSLAGVIVFLLWLWLTNLALLFGAELDAELERGRQLQAGIEAEESVQLPARDTRKIDKAKTQHESDVARGRELRESHGETDGKQGADGRSDGHSNGHSNGHANGHSNGGARSEGGLDSTDQDAGQGQGDRERQQSQRRSGRS